MRKSQSQNIEAIVLRCQACYFSLNILFVFHTLINCRFEFCVLNLIPWLYVTFMSMEEIIHLVTMISVTNL